MTMTNPEAVEAPMTDSPELSALVERLRELLAKAELGELRYQDASDAYTHILRQGEHEFVVQFGQSTNPKYEARARLFAEAVNALPTLLAALSSAPVAGEAERICREAAAWEREQAAKPDAGKKAASNHLGAAQALDMAADRIAALSHASPVDEGMVMAAAKAAWRADMIDKAEQRGHPVPDSFDFDWGWDQSASMPLSGPGFVRQWTTIAKAALLAASTPKDTGERG